MKSLSETIQEVETKKRQLEENVDLLSEKLTAASAAGMEESCTILHLKKVSLYIIQNDCFTWCWVLYFLTPADPNLNDSLCCSFKYNKMFIKVYR